jgi:hypothetical protein
MSDELRLTLTSKPLSNRVKPTLETKFHIDYDWWKREERDLRTYLLSHLMPEQRGQFENRVEDDQIDWIDPETAEVRRVDALQQALTTAARDPQFITDRTTLVDAIFRIYLSNGNKPLSPEELSRLLNRPAITILRTLAGAQVYKGLRPVTD